MWLNFAAKKLKNFAHIFQPTSEYDLFMYHLIRTIRATLHYLLFNYIISTRLPFTLCGTKHYIQSYEFELMFSINSLAAAAQLFVIVYVNSMAVSKVNILQISLLLFFNFWNDEWMNDFCVLVWKGSLNSPRAQLLSSLKDWESILCSWWNFFFEK